MRCDSRRDTFSAVESGREVSEGAFTRGEGLSRLINSLRIMFLR